MILHQNSWVRFVYKFMSFWCSCIALVKELCSSCGKNWKLFCLFFLFWKLLNDVLALLHVVKVWKNLPMRWHWSVSHWDGLGLWSIGMTLALSHWEELGCESLLLCFFSFIIHLSPVCHEQFHNFIFQITAFGFNPIPIY